jgi:hypothetical protein
LAPNITSVRINQGKVKDDYGLPFNFDKLRHLDVTEPKIYSKFLEQFLINSKNLSSIIFKCDFYRSSKTQLNKINYLPKLKWLDTEISFPEVYNICGNSELFSTKFYDPQSLHLAELNTHFLSINAGNINFLLVNRSLNHLILTDVSLGDKGVINLPYLKTLTLNEKTENQVITEHKVIKKILLYTPMLEQFLITDVSFKEKDFEPGFELKKLNHLKKIIISNASISLAFINCLIKMSPKSITITLMRMMQMS